MTIDSRTLYATLLGLKPPWEITDVELKCRSRDFTRQRAMDSVTSPRDYATSIFSLASGTLSMKVCIGVLP